jgi:hypothetical protein
MARLATLQWERALVRVFVARLALGHARRLVLCVALIGGMTLQAFDVDVFPSKGKLRVVMLELGRFFPAIEVVAHVALRR